MDADQIARELHEYWGPYASDFARRHVPDPVTADAILKGILGTPRDTTTELDQDSPEPGA